MISSLCPICNKTDLEFGQNGMCDCVKSIKEKILTWEFATCPIEEGEPFFWRWKEHELEMLAGYIHGLLEEEHTRLLNEIGKMKKRNDQTEIIHINRFSDVYNSALEEVKKLLEK